MINSYLFIILQFGLLASWVLMFGNEMLVTSWLCCCLSTAVIIFYLFDPLLVKFKSEFKFDVPSIIPAIFKPMLLLAGTVAFKVVIGKLLRIRDDVSTIFFGWISIQIEICFYAFIEIDYRSFIIPFLFCVGTHRSNFALKVH